MVRCDQTMACVIQSNRQICAGLTAFQSSWCEVQAFWSQDTIALHCPMFSKVGSVGVLGDFIVSLYRETVDTKQAWLGQGKLVGFWHIHCYWRSNVVFVWDSGDFYYEYAIHLAGANLGAHRVSFHQKQSHNTERIYGESGSNCISCFIQDANKLLFV